MSDKIAEVIGAALAVCALLFLAAVVSGTFLWMIYPHIHSLFPTAVAKGIIAQDLRWWDAVCVTWIFGILIKSSHSSSSKSED